jgi:hypothetical protein
MQTFIVSKNVEETAKILDQKRLGKQRVEAIQIARCLLGKTEKKGWRNHPAVKMWKGYESYLVKVYLRGIMDEWVRRGYKNTKCEEHYEELSCLVDNNLEEPKWYCQELFESHKSNLVRKRPDIYQEIFPDVEDGLEYVWPV